MRILYIHVGTVWVAYLAFVVTAVSSAAYLWKRTTSLTWDRIAGASAEIGVLFMAVTLFAGALWGRLSWGTFWVWDARVTTTAFLFITYVGYLAVRGLGGSHQQRARRSAVVALLAVLEIPLVHFSVKLWRSVHQDASVAGNSDVTLDGLMLFTLLLGAGGVHAAVRVVGAAPPAGAGDAGRARRPGPRRCARRAPRRGLQSMQRGIG